VTFYLKELTTALRSRLSTCSTRSRRTISRIFPLVIGAREPEKRVVWDGLVDDFRLSRCPRSNRNSLLLTRESGGRRHGGLLVLRGTEFLQRLFAQRPQHSLGHAPTGGADAKTAALIDFCHLLFNANEFLYVD